MGLKINLGCGNKKIDGYVGVDKTNTSAVDVIHDLNVFPYPFEENSVSEILLDNVLEHLDNPMKILEELYRICLNNAKIKIYVPYFKSNGAFTDITHKKFFSENSFNFLNKDHEYNFYTNINLKVTERKLLSMRYNKNHVLRNLLPFKKFLNHFLFNIYDEIYFELVCIKE